MKQSLVLNTQELLDWYRNLAAALHNGYSDEAIALLIDALKKLIDGSDYALIVYPKGAQPFWHCHHLQPGQDPTSNIDRYVQGAYLLDPFYRLSVEQRIEGVYTLAEVAPSGFKQSEYYRVYYLRVNLNDEICLVFQAPDECAITISLSRHIGEPRFNLKQKTLLETVYPLVQEIVLQWWQNQRRKPALNSLEARLDTALANFGSSLLTQREAEILQLTLRGHAVKSIAQKLNVSPETVKHHRKNIYTKLDVSSQAEMFYLFIDSLRRVTADSPADPLVKYLEPAQNSG